MRRFLVFYGLAILLLCCGEVSSQVEVVAMTSTMSAQVVGQAIQRKWQHETDSYHLMRSPTNKAESQSGCNMAITPTMWDMVRGTVLIEDGRCCAGGEVGEQLVLEVQLLAIGNHGKITHIRYLSGAGPFTRVDFDGVAFIPYRERITVETRVTVNWVGFWVGVQFLDEHGNLSGIFNDDISIEGWQPQLTNSPGET
jgi:hypothetical protein